MPIRVPMPAPGVDLRRYFEERVAQGELDLALDLSVIEFDELAQLSGVAVTSVETSATGIALDYAVCWTSFHACDDRSFEGRHARLLRGRAEGGAWVFERAAPPQREADEF